MTRPSLQIVPWALAVGAALTLTEPAAAQQRTRGEKYALLVAVRQYARSELRSLPYAERDVEQLARVLLQSGYRKENILLMTQRAGAEDTDLLPTAANIRARLQLLLQDRVPADSLLVAFAGHGVQFRGDAESYFCPADARLANRKGTLLPLGEIYRQLAACPANFKVLLVDACRNDPVVDASRQLPQVKLKSGFRPANVPAGGLVALFSCSEGERAYEHDRLRHGVFFHFVIQGLKGAADYNQDRRVTVPELLEYLQERVPSFVRAEYKVRQMPELMGQLRGSVPLVAWGERPLLEAESRPAPKPSPTPGGRGKITVAERRKIADDSRAEEGPARLAVRVPENATLEVDGRKTRATGIERSFQTPPLPVGKRFSYRVRVLVPGAEGGQVYEGKVIVNANEEVRLELTDGPSVQPPPAPAGRASLKLVDQRELDESWRDRDAPARLEVRVPVNATVEFDGRKILSKGGTRLLESPPLSAGKTFRYQIRVTVPAADGERAYTMVLRVRANMAYTVALQRE